MIKRLFVVGLSGLMLATACTSNQPETPATTASPESGAAYVESINQWHQEREANLKKEDGWLALAGLFWLKPGTNTFGSARENSIVFPEGKVPASAGSFILAGDKVSIKPAPSINIKLNGEAINEETVIYTSGKEEVPQLTYGSLTWFVIRRGDQYGIRLRDSESKARANFKGVDRYEVSPAWRVQARLEPNAFPKKIAITNVLGQTSEEDSPGALVFTVDGKEYRLDALQEEDKLFIIFADKTNGTETYGAGRYLYAARPAADGTTVLDFNKATNPPCAFVPYATCPLPPRQNFLPIPVPAGERSYEAGH
ncbi:DUF1684 domain-containing protein [Pontibacter vulgaris]|uniref:DUF1684 domain-containing protein n=1 Tax=Pontibacter vulgaris TaxID=2905679 RepID=UPI001FA78EB4|nr:DUF1684 domain-containing protein [Pontibacter vulgaris]